VITGYASLASAVETMRLGAGDYLPKPFTPEELEQAVEKMLGSIPPPVAKAPESQELPEEGPIDVDMPFDAREVARATSPAYVERLGRSDMPVVDARSQVTTPPSYCATGERSCKKFAKKGACKGECPLVAAERNKGIVDVGIGAFVADPIDVDMPFSAREVAAITSEAYVAALGRSDMPVVGRYEAKPPLVEKRKVLVVDDEPVVANTIRRALGRRGHAVDEAFSTQDALSRVRSSHYDLVLLDMRMPDGNGLETLEQLKSINADLPVVIVTGYASIGTAVEAMRRGASDFVSKPFTANELFSVTDRLLAAA
jgi:ActR/RegA family two-component response regulator